MAFNTLTLHLNQLQFCTSYNYIFFSNFIAVKIMSTFGLLILMSMSVICVKVSKIWIFPQQ